MAEVEENMARRKWARGMPVLNFHHLNFKTQSYPQTNSRKTFTGEQFYNALFKANCCLNVHNVHFKLKVTIANFGINTRCLAKHVEEEFFKIIASLIL